MYSIETGIVLRTINSNDYGHLSWVAKNIPEGTALYTIDKKTVGADEFNCPNLDILIPIIEAMGGPKLSFGKTCSVISEDGTVVENVHACPTLYQRYLDKEKKGHMVIHHISGEVGDVYDKIQDKFIKGKIKTNGN